MNALRKLRVLAGLSQPELHQRSGVAQNTISELERGARTARPATLRKLAEALEVEVEDLILEDETPKGSSPSREGARGGQVRKHPPFNVRTARFYGIKARARESTRATERERILSYLRISELQIERMRARWEEAIKDNTFSRGAWSEAVEAAMEWDRAFAEAVPVSVYAREGEGGQWLPEEEWEAVAVVLGGRSRLHMTLDEAYFALESRFDDLSGLREQKDRFGKIPEEFAERSWFAG